MSLHLRIYDLLTQKSQRVSAAYAFCRSDDFPFPVTAPAGQSSFTVVGGTVTASGRIDCLVNGVIAPESVSAIDGWQRNAAQNKIVFNNPLKQNANLVVRLFS